MRRTSLLAVLALFLLAAPAQAHDFSTSYSEIRVYGPRVDVALTLNVVDMHRGPLVDADMDGVVTEAELDTALDTLTAALVENYTVSVPGAGPVQPELAGHTFVNGNVVRLDFVYLFDTDAGDLRVVSRLDRLTQDDHRHLMQIGSGDALRHAVLSRDAPEVDVDYAMGIPFWVTMLDFVTLGIEHIFTGYDHLAFLVGLLVATTTLISLVKVVTAFTVGHSVTLVLATLGVVTIPSRLVESLIALSIAYVAAENFLGRTLVHRWMITFLFGLVHGFGFSNVLRELGLGSSRLAVSLFSFNAGVEVGQIAFVALVFPAIWYLRKFPWKAYVMDAASVGIMCLGFYWFVQRAVLG